MTTDTDEPPTALEALTGDLEALQTELDLGDEADERRVAELMFSTTVHGGVLSLLMHPDAHSYIVADAIVDGRTAEVMVRWVDGPDTPTSKLSALQRELDAANEAVKRLSAVLGAAGVSVGIVESIRRGDA